AAASKVTGGHSASWWRASHAAPGSARSRGKRLAAPAAGPCRARTSSGSLQASRIRGVPTSIPGSHAQWTAGPRAAPPAAGGVAGEVDGARAQRREGPELRDGRLRRAAERHQLEVPADREARGVPAERVELALHDDDPAIAGDRLAGEAHAEEASALDGAAK